MMCAVLRRARTSEASLAEMFAGLPTDACSAIVPGGWYVVDPMREGSDEHRDPQPTARLFDCPVCRSIKEATLGHRRCFFDIGPANAGAQCQVVLHHQPACPSRTNVTFKLTCKPTTFPSFTSASCSDHALTSRRFKRYACTIDLKLWRCSAYFDNLAQT